MIGGLLTGIATSPLMRAALRYGTITLTVLLFLLSPRRSGERAGRLAERLDQMETTNDVQRRMPEGINPTVRSGTQYGPPGQNC